MISAGSTSPVWSCEVIMATRGVVSFTEASYLSSDVATGFISPRPPSLTGRASRSLVTFEQGGRPVRAGMKTWWIAFSRGWKRSLIPGTVLDKYVHLLESPWTKAL